MKQFIIAVLLVFITLAANAQISLAVMDFKPGSNMNSNLDGLSDMLINSLFDSGNYDIVERSQIEYALNELGIQGKNYSVAQLTQVGEYLNVDNVLVGTVNFIATGNLSYPGFQKGEYNIDVRIINVKSSRVIATAGVVKDNNQTYRSLMPELARQLSSKLSSNSLPCLQGYLCVYPEYLGSVTYAGAEDKARHLNAVSAYGRSDWRIPTYDELLLILKSRSSEERIKSILDEDKCRYNCFWSSNSDSPGRHITKESEYFDGRFYIKEDYSRPDNWAAGIILVATRQ